MKVLVIPDIHLKPWIFWRASELMEEGAAEQAVCLMDIPDDFGKEYDLDLYDQTFDAAIAFQRSFPDTLWCWGNHDLSYVWRQPESGFSTHALMLCRKKIEELRTVISNETQLVFIHRIDDVLFSHGGLSRWYVDMHTEDESSDIDAVIRKINGFGFDEMWLDSSPIWVRPFYWGRVEMYGKNELLQVVGHTPVIQPYREENVVFCDLFSTDRDGKPIGTQEFVLIDTKTWDFRGVK